MNGFELRQRNRQQKAKLRRELKSFTKVLDAAGVQRFFEDAYIQLHGREPNLRYKAGWFYLQGKRVSMDDLYQRGRMLFSQLHEQELDNESDS